MKPTDRELIRGYWRGREEEANAARDSVVPLRNPHVELADYVDEAIACGEDPSRCIWHVLDGRGMRDDNYEAWHVGAGILRGMRTPSAMFHGGWGSSVHFTGRWRILGAVAAYPEDLAVA